MKKEVNYIEEHQWDKSVFEKGEAMPLTNEQKAHFDLLRSLIETKESQYERRRNEQKWDNFVEVLYPSLCHIAEIQGGYVKMNACEDTYFAELIYIGENLILDIDGVEGLADFNEILSAADSFSIVPEKEGFRMRFTFSLYDRVKIADMSERIAVIEKKMKQLATREE